MDFPFALLALLALPFFAAAVIVTVSSVRRGRHAGADGTPAEPRHRGQTDTAAVQTATVRPRAAGRKVASGRDRRADAGKHQPMDG